MRKSYIVWILALALLLTACSGTADTTPALSASNSFNETETEPTASEIAAGDSFTDRDLAGTYDKGEAAAITLNGNSASSGADGVTVDGGTVTITEEGVYVLSGTLSDGMIVVNTDKKSKVQLVLSGAEINSSTSAAIYVLQADKVFVTLDAGTENVLANGGSFAAIDENNIDAVLFSKEDLTLNGSGSLTITSPAGHGVVSKDELTVTGGNYEINAASHGMSGKDNVCIAGGSLTIAAGKDGIQAEHAEDAALGFVYIEGGAFDITAEGDGISASSNLDILGGDFTIRCGGGYENGEQKSSGNWGMMGGGPGGPGGRGGPGQKPEATVSDADSTSMKGIKAAGNMNISGGRFTLDTADDSIHSDACITISGGSYNISSGDDGVHAEDTLTVMACDMTVANCYEGLEAENIDVQGGKIHLTCSDDGLNASGGKNASGTAGGRDGKFGGGMMFGESVGEIVISGGNLTIYAGGDGLDSNGDLLISGGYTRVFNPQPEDTSVLDSQNPPAITGGTYIGLGISTMMAEVFSAEKSTQGFIACTIGNQPAGVEITIADSEGNPVISCTTEYSTVLLIVSSPEIRKGDSYTVTAGTVSGTISAN